MPTPNWKMTADHYAATVARVRGALQDAINGSSGCVYGPGCEDCWVCRGEEVLESTSSFGFTPNRASESNSHVHPEENQ